MRTLRNDFINSFKIKGRTSRGAKENVIIKSLLRVICENEFAINNLLTYDKDVIVNFDEVYNADGGVRIMLEILNKSIGDEDFIYEYDKDDAFSEDSAEELCRFYDILKQLGYGISDEETRLMEGTHEIYKKYKG